MGNGNTMADISGLLGANAPVATNSTSRKGNTELNMEDFLKLMVVQLQSQTIDDAMDTSEMMNQMVQMQMITAITNMTETNIMTYASSLVGKVVTIGITDGNSLEEREILVMGTGMLNGQQVIFGSDGETYGLNQIMAVGRLPDIEEPGEGEEKPGEGEDGDGSTDGVDKPDGSTDKPNVDDTDKTEGSGDTAQGGTGDKAPEAGGAEEKSR